MNMQTLYWRRDYFKRVYYKNVSKIILTANGTLGGATFAVAASAEINASRAAWKAFDGIDGSADGESYLWHSTQTVSNQWYTMYYPQATILKSLGVKNSNYALHGAVTSGSVLASNDNATWTTLKAWTNSITKTGGAWSIDLSDSVTAFKYYKVTFSTGTYNYVCLGEFTPVAIIISTAEDCDYYVDYAGTAEDYTYYIEKRVNHYEEYTYTTEAEILETRKGPNLRFGIRHFGKFGFAAPTNIVDEGGGDLPDDKINYLPGIHAVIAYNKDGTKTAIFGAGSERDAIESMNFELVETGCGKVEISFRKLPTNAELNYRQRIDIHLFNDSRPWWSGYIITRPITGTSDTNVYKFTGHGYYNLLDKVLIFKTYENIEVSNIVVDIARQVENKVGLIFNGNKIINTSYVISKIEFDGVTAKEALKQLTDFAIDYVYGVDEYRQLYFMPRNNEINEQARFWVGMHIGPYSPAWDVDKIVNRAYIKGGNVDDKGEQWLGMVEDTDSQEEYGIQEAVWSLPSAYSTDDAKRWGQNQIEKYKEPVKSAKVTNAILEYPKPDGSFFVRKLSTQGQAAITDLDGNRHDYPITKLKYTISGKDGIKLDMELGEQPFAVDKYFANLDRDAKMAELLQQAATKQLKTGG